MRLSISHYGQPLFLSIIHINQQYKYAANKLNIE